MSVRLFLQARSFVGFASRFEDYRCINKHQKLFINVRCGSTNVTLPKGPELKDFISNSNSSVIVHDNTDCDTIPYIDSQTILGNGRQVYFETYGCQMNVNDTEIAWSILKDSGYNRTTSITEADVILTVTCAIRDNAEKKVWSRLHEFKHMKERRRINGQPSLKVGVLGCMAERLKEELLETKKMVDLVAGPDSYRDLPRMLSVTDTGQAAVNVQLSLDETYADVSPVRMSDNSHTAFVSIMRGCDNMCSFCIVPFTRGRERSRSMSSILEEVKKLSSEGVKEITLLGQNVNSYCDHTHSDLPSLFCSSSSLSQGFSTIYKNKDGGRRFAELLHYVAQIDPEMRIRFTSPHPKDFPNKLLEVIKSNNNVCNHVHLPVQSGSTAMLKKMRRGHSRESYLDLVNDIRETIPGVALSSDFIAGFCGETDADHEDTLSLLKAVDYDMAYMFAYSMRKKTHAYHRMQDDVSAAIKKQRLNEIVDCFYSSASINKQKKYVGTSQLVLVEGISKKSIHELVGRNDSNIKVVFPNNSLPSDVLSHDSSDQTVPPKPGDYVKVMITEASAITLRAQPLLRTNLQTFFSNNDQ